MTYNPKSNNPATASSGGYMTQTQASKLDGIAAGADVNVNADWNAGSGDAQILNKPTIPSAYTDEQAQDAVGNILTDSATVDFTYDDAGGSITAAVKSNSVTAGMLHAAATDVVFGRSSAGAGAGEEITVTSAARSILDDATVGPSCPRWAGCRWRAERSRVM